VDEDAGVVVGLDASALLAYLHGEPGGTRVREQLRHAAISSVNWSEVVQKALAHGTDVGGLREELESFGLQIVDFNPSDGEDAAHLWAQTRQLGLSLADRACLALGRRLGVPVLTADQTWTAVPSGVATIQTIR
jgi:ribonuclease VapC